MNDLDNIDTQYTEPTTRDELINTVARIWAQSIANQDARPPVEAAKAAGCTSEKDIAEWVARYRPNG